MTTTNKIETPNKIEKTSNKIQKLVRNQRGAGLTEYIMLVGLIALFAIGAFKLFGSSVSQKINNQSKTVQGINDAAGQ